MKIGPKVTVVIVLSMLAMAIAVLATANLSIRSGFSQTSQVELKKYENIVNTLMERQKADILALGRVISDNPLVVKAVKEKDTAALRKMGKEILKQTGLEYITWADVNGKIIGRGHSDKFGDVMSDQENFKSGITGQEAVCLEDGIIVKMSLRGGFPVKHEGQIVGMTSTGGQLASAKFVDMIKATLGVECTIYSQDNSLASTFIKDGQRSVGDKIVNPVILDKVLKKGETYHENAIIGGKGYFTSYWPIRYRSGDTSGIFFIAVDDAISHSTQNRIIWSVVIISLIFIVAVAVIMIVVINRVIVSPLKATTKAIEQMALGDLSYQLTYQSKDEIGQMATALRETTEVQRARAQLTSRIAGGDLTAGIALASDHDVLGKALLEMTEKLNLLIGQTSEAANRVESGSGNILGASQSLSQRATQSAASVEEIASSITEIAAQTKTNAENAGQANQLVGQARAVAELGNEELGKMIVAMNEIQGYGQQIVKIVKMIDDIAFQTNMLALNAAVEAARAGRHGKGFAVVANEVRNLAGRSAKAAKETAELVEGTVKKMENGTALAASTENVLREIVGFVVKVSERIGEIAEASNEQAKGIAQISQGLSQMEGAIQQDTINAQETAEAANALFNQASDLHQVMAQFKLKSQSVDYLPAIRSGVGQALMPAKRSKS